LSLFAGFTFGNFPHFSRDIYEAKVNDFKVQGATNITTKLAVQFFKNFIFDIQMDFSPVVANGGVSYYMTSEGEDNCVWVWYGWEFFNVDTKIGKNLPTCGFNLRDAILKADKWSDVLLGKNIDWKELFACKPSYEESVNW